MSNTVSYSLFLHSFKRLFNLCLILEGLLVDEGTELGLAIDALDLREDEFNRLEVIPVRHIPDGIDVQTPELFNYLWTLVCLHVVHEAMNALGNIQASQVLEELDEVILVDGLVEEHDGLHSAVYCNSRNDSNVA